MVKNKCPTLTEFLPIHATIYYYKSLGISGGEAPAPPLLYQLTHRKNESLSRKPNIYKDSSYYYPRSFTAIYYSRAYKPHH